MVFNVVNKLHVVVCVRRIRIPLGESFILFNAKAPYDSD